MSATTYISITDTKENIWVQDGADIAIAALEMTGEGLETTTYPADVASWAQETSVKLPHLTDYFQELKEVMDTLACNVGEKEITMEIDY